MCVHPGGLDVLRHRVDVVMDLVAMDLQRRHVLRSSAHPRDFRIRNLEELPLPLRRQSLRRRHLEGDHGHPIAPDPLGRLRLVDLLDTRLEARVGVARPAVLRVHAAIDQRAVVPGLRRVDMFVAIPHRPAVVPEAVRQHRSGLRPVQLHQVYACHTIPSPPGIPRR